MKKLLAIILAASFTLSLAACGQAETVKKKIKETENEVIESEVIESFEDFKDNLDENSNIKETVNQDGSVIVELEMPSTPETEDTFKPAIPTIDRVKPIRNDETEPTEKIGPSDEIEKPTNPQQPVEPETSVEPQEPSLPQEPTAPEAPVEPEKPTEPVKPIEAEKPVEPVKPAKPTYTYTSNQKHQKLHYTKRYLYNILNDEQKGWYRQIDQAVNNIEEKVEINANLSENRNYYIYFLYMADNPEHFYLANTVSIYSYGNGKGALRFAYAVGREKDEYCGSGCGELTEELREKIKTKKAIFNAELNSIVSTIPSDAPAVWKERLIYERILLDSHYNLGARWDGLANDNWTSYGILVNKYGVCESYSEAFQTLCFAVGINCCGVVGTAGGGHKWNAVQLDGEWYMCDITFDDPIGNSPDDAYHYYFNRTSQWFAEDNHNWDNCDWPVPVCNGTKYSFDNYF